MIANVRVAPANGGGLKVGTTHGSVAFRPAASYRTVTLTVFAGMNPRVTLHAKTATS